MVYPFVCGIGGLYNQEEEDDEPCSSPCSTPRKQRKSCLLRRNRDSQNPYADRGLDKFSALLAELEEKRQKIYTQKGSQDISSVRFVYSNSNDWKPVVVRLKERKQDKNINIVDNNKHKPVAHDSEPLEEMYPIEPSTSLISKKKKSSSWKLKMDIWRPSFYLTLMVILILVFLAVFSRSFAILCTSIGWYFVPTIKRGSSNLKRASKKKDLARRVSEKNIVTDHRISSPKRADVKSLHQNTVTGKVGENDSSSLL